LLSRIAKLFSQKNMGRILRSKSFIALGCLLLWLLAVAVYQTYKSLPHNVNYLGEQYRLDSSRINFLYDLTYLSKHGKIVHEQNIFDALFHYIDQAEKYILIDMFLFNSYKAKNDTVFRDLSRELTDKLIERKKQIPGIYVDFITDPINTVYDGGISKEIERLKSSGIHVITSNLRKLRDSNIIYSPIWRTCIQWFGNSNRAGTIKHPFSTADGKVTLRSYLSLMNFKANHRKVFVADNHGEMISLITSANPHGGSSAHSNVALSVKGDVWQSIYAAEQAVARMSGASLSNYNNTSNKILSDTDATIKILSEYQIKKALIEEINDAESASIIRIAQFYLSDRDIIKYLLSASDRGVDIKIILDPNKDAFGYEKNGIPNRQVAHELVSKTKERIKIRWYDTHGEQFHSKLFLSARGPRFSVIVGSANLTRRNLDNYNLELDIKVVVQKKSQLAQEIMRYFDRLWNNENGLFTVDYEHYKEDSSLKTFLYRIQEGFGLSTF